MLSVPIVVNVEVPAYRDGLVATFGDAGFSVETPENLEEWATEAGRRAIVVSINSPDDCQPVARLRLQGNDLVILAVLADPTSALYREALRCGASAAVAWDASVEMILQAFRSALDHQCMIPLAVMQALVGARPEAGTTVIEERWLRMMSAGRSSDEVANDAGYPERDMLHILHDLYERLGLSAQTDVPVPTGRRTTGEAGEDRPPPP